jgi:hypothetical protein
VAIIKNASMTMDSEEIYKMTFRKHLNYIWISLMFFLIAPGIYLYSLVNGQSNGSFILILIIWIVFGLFYINGFRLHFSYYRYDKNKRIIIYNSNITISDNTDSYSFSNDDIDSITNHHSGLHNRTPWNDYGFSVFRLKNGKEFIITCLLLDWETIIDKFPTKSLIQKSYFIATLTKK